MESCEATGLLSLGDLPERTERRRPFAAYGATIGARFEALYLPPPSRPDKPLMVKTLIVPTPEYQEGRNVILTTGRSIYTIVLRHLIEQRADWSWTAVQITEKKART